MAALFRSMRSSPSAMSTWFFGSYPTPPPPRREASPHVLTWTFAESSGPTGTLPSIMFGMALAILRYADSASSHLAIAASRSEDILPICDIICDASSPLFFACDMPTPILFLSARSSSAATMVLLLSASRATSASRSYGTERALSIPLTSPVRSFIASGSSTVHHL